MNRLLANPKFLAVYSGVLTVAFVLTVIFGTMRGVFSRRAAFDQITVHRINIVEPDGVPRLILSDKSEYPGSFYHGQEIARPDRTDSAGMLFMNDEGTENGGLLIGGYRGKDGSAHSWGHLSFDGYEQDQSLAIESEQNGGDRDVHYRINDNGPGPITPEAMNAFENVRKLPTNTAEERIAKEKAQTDVVAKYGLRGYPRADLSRNSDHSVALRLKDNAGHDRIVLRVAPDGKPSVEFFDDSGHAVRPWAEK
jgi:hypothetical protein